MYCVQEMLFPLLLTLFNSARSADIDPSLNDWKLIESNVEKFMFPIKDYILEVKSFRPDHYNANPSFEELSQLDRTFMILELHEGGWNNRVGRLVWNTIKYDLGQDVLVEECNRQYSAYRSFPAGGKKEQLWAWNINSEDAELTCDEELQYSQLFAEGDADTGNSGRCQALGKAPVDRIILKFMEGCYVRAVPKIGELKYPEYPTCDCWHPRCGYCTDLACTVEQDFSSSLMGVQVTSKLKRKKYNTLVLYDEAGLEIGKFHWSRMRVFLTGGCIQCATPASVRRLRGVTTWNFSLKEGVIRIHVEGEVVFERQLKDKCATRYGGAKRFAFYNMGCENSFRLTEEMVAGDLIAGECPGAC